MAISSFWASRAGLVAFYFIFFVFFAVASWRAREALRWLCALALLHALGWLTIVLIRGPENLVFGLPLPLKGILWIGTATPLLTLAAICLAWRNRTFLSIASAEALALYVPFVFYWNLRARIGHRRLSKKTLCP